MIIAVDFDGTIAESEWPEIGAPMPGAIETLNALKKDGHSIILWTCRSKEHLDNAVDWLFNQGFVPEAVNKNVERDYLTLGDTRKIYCDVLIDDRCFYACNRDYDWSDVWRRYIDDNPPWEADK